MYKKQLGFQKFACLLAIISAAVYFVYALGFITDIYDSLYPTMMNPDDLTQTWVPGSYVYYAMYEFNKLFVDLSIGLILLAGLLFLMNTNIRRKYYIGNYVAIGLYSVASIALTVWSHLQISAYKVEYLKVDFVALKSFAELWKTPYSESTFLLDLHYAVAGLSILSVAVLVGNMIWKINLMRGESKLIAEGKEAAV